MKRYIVLLVTLMLMSPINGLRHGFHPQSSSPLIGLGIVLSEVSADFDGISRPQEWDYDYDIGSTVVSPPNLSTGAIYYVAQDGSGDFTTIQQAAESVQPGDMVYVRTGTYEEDITIKRSGTEISPILFHNAPDEHPVVQGAFRLENRSYVHIVGFEITGETAQWCAIYIKGESHHLLIEDNDIHNTSADHSVCIIGSSFNILRGNTISYGYNGIEIGGSTCQYNIVEYNHVFYNDKALGNSDGIHLYGSSTNFNVIKGNIVHDNSDDGIDTWSSSHNLITANIAYHNGYMHDGASGYDGNGFKLGGVSGGAEGGGNLVINNTAYDNRTVGFTTNGGPLPNTLYNNDSYNNLYYGFEEWSGSGGSTFRNNISYMNGRKNCSFTSDTKSSHNLFSEDPLFVNATNGDFHLRAGSPAIDRGTSLSRSDVPDVFLTDVQEFFRDEVLRQIEVDLEGASRAQGTGYDIGAYESPFSTRITDLRVIDATGDTLTLTLTLRWTAPAAAVTYSMRSSNTLLTMDNWSHASIVTVPFTASELGSSEWLTAPVDYSGGTLYLALRSQNSAAIWSELSNNAFWPHIDVYLPLIMKDYVPSSQDSWLDVKPFTKT